MYQLIGANFGWGAQQKECELGPDQLYSQGLLKYLQSNRISCQWESLYPATRIGEGAYSFPETLGLLELFTSQLADAVTAALDSHAFPIILGGDHSIAVGTWNGFFRHFQKEHHHPMGLIWIDAHMDAHTLETTPSKAWHGMPVAALLGYGESKIAHLLQAQPVLAPENLCLIGTRSFEEGEAELLKRLNVKIFSSEEVLSSGMETIMGKAIEHVLKNAKILGVSCDLDIIDPKESPGIGSPEKAGISSSELLKGLAILTEHPAFKAFELVEYNPTCDIENRTGNICFEILLKIMRPNGMDVA